MKQIDLNGPWEMRAAGDGEWLAATVPGSVASTLLAHGKMADPNYRDNEAKVQPLFDKDYEFRRRLTVPAEALAHDKVLLHCDGLDTIAALSLNGASLASTDNMHRTWVFDVKDKLRQGENTLSILFSSPVKYLETHPAQTGKRFATIRKAACMFGWDWGLSLPDSGIWRDIYIETFDHAALGHATIRQRHTPGRVDIQAALHAEVWGEGVQAHAELLAPDGAVLSAQTSPATERQDFTFTVENPQLWWPAGHGAQPLYTLKTALYKDGALLGEKAQQIGLRTIVLNRDKKPGGSNYGFVVNGTPIFFKGENLVIEDAVLSRTTNARWDRLLANCLRSNLNGIRVWGGAYYPPDHFFEQCDKLGLLVWQDLMFACTFYMPTDDFVDNVRHEVADNLKRIAHHPCLALVCGNNEVESLYTVMGSKEPETVALRKLFGREKRAGFLMRRVVWKIYKKLFLDVIPPLCMQYAPDASYVHSSPSTRKPRGAKSFFDYLSDGDMHYYLQYNGNAPYQKLRTVRCRFMTEMGFQSYPSMKTIAAFAEETDRTPYSDVMYAHQKCKDGNEAIELYMGRDYRVPENFADYVYLSQLQAGEIMKYSIEHLRRDSGYCNGMVIWQLNDCWPVVSWSGIDYFGRWKAQQYYTRRFYEPVLLSALDEGPHVGLWVTNNGPDEAECTLVWRLVQNGGKLLDEGQAYVQAAPGASREYVPLDYSSIINEAGHDDVYLCYHLQAGGRVWGQGVTLFCLAKEFRFARPELRLDVDEVEDGYTITVAASCFVKGLALDTRAGDGIFSDNFFDLPEGESRTVTLKKADATGIGSLEALKGSLFATCLNNVLLDAGLHTPK